MTSNNYVLEFFSWNQFHKNFREIDFTKKNVVISYVLRIDFQCNPRLWHYIWKLRAVFAGLLGSKYTIWHPNCIRLNDIGIRIREGIVWHIRFVTLHHLFVYDHNRQGLHWSLVRKPNHVQNYIVYRIDFVVL